MDMKKALVLSSVVAIGVGVCLGAGGVWGIAFTYGNVARERIVTPPDAAIPGAPVRGPLTLKAEADVIRKHTLETTGGKIFAEMPRQVPTFDEHGAEIIDAEGKPVMTVNTARDIWITATTLTTALHLGILTYVFSSLIILFGCVSVWTGIVFALFGRRYIVAQTP